jgi:hypothetical protein
MQAGHREQAARKEENLVKEQRLWTIGVLLAIVVLHIATGAVPAQAQSGEDGIKIVLTWEPEGTDVDMHVFDPDNTHAWFGELRGIPGAVLDTDDQREGGPETFTMADPRPGRYRVRVNYFRGDMPVDATLQVTINGDVKFEETQRLTRSDGNSTRGVPQNNPESLWDAYEFVYSDVGDMTLSPEESTRLAGQEDCVVATVFDESNQPLEGIQVDFAVSGDNAATGSATSGPDGQTEPFCYTGSNPGSDTIVATAGSVSATVAKTWIDWLFWLLVALGVLVLLGVLLALLRLRSGPVTSAAESEPVISGSPPPRPTPPERPRSSGSGGGGVSKQ